MKLFFYLLGIIFLISCNSSSYYTSQWHTKGDKEPASVFHKENRLSVAVSNDEEYLYLKIESTNPETIQKVKKLGLSVWLSNGENPNKSWGIHYPLPFENTERKAALEGFNQEPLVALPLTAIAPIKIMASFLPEDMKYSIKVPLSELQIDDKGIFTVSLASFSLGKQEYLTGLTTAEEIERRLDEYKANPYENKNKPELIPFFATFQLAKMPNKNP